MISLDVYSLGSDSNSPEIHLGESNFHQLSGFSPTRFGIAAQLIDGGLKPGDLVVAFHPRHEWRG